MRNRAIWLKNWCPHVLSKKWLYNMCERLRESSQKVFEQSTIKDEDWQNARKNGKIPRRCWGFLKLALETKHEELDVTAPTKTLTRTGPPRKKVKALALMETLVLAETILLKETLLSAVTLWGRRGEGFQKGSGMGILSLTTATKLLF